MFRINIVEIQVLLSSFDLIRIEYQCNWTNVLLTLRVLKWVYIEAGVFLPYEFDIS